LRERLAANIKSSLELFAARKPSNDSEKTVDIGTDAKLLGTTSIDDNGIIAAATAVLCDMPSDLIAVSVRRTIKPRGNKEQPSFHRT
jgi:serine acetyltransferase